MMKFNVGDKVFIKQSLGKSRECCCYGINDEMEAMCGQLVTIRTADPVTNNPDTTGQYYLEEDPGRWLWSDNCFDPLGSDIEDVEIDVSGLL